MSESRICSLCNQSKTSDQFYARKQYGRIYLDSKCKPCCIALLQKYRLKPDIKERQRAYDRERSKDPIVKAKKREQAIARNEKLRPLREATKAAKMPPPGFKKCGRCKELKTHEMFYVVKSRYDGIDAMCKNCRRTASRSSMEKYLSVDANRQKALEKDRRYYRTNPARREAAKANFIRWAKENPEKAKEVAIKAGKKYGQSAHGKAAKKQWRKENPDKVREYQRKHHQTAAWKSRHAKRESLRRATLQGYVYGANRRVKRDYGVGQFLTLEAWQRVLEVFDYRCIYCGIHVDDLPKKFPMEMEHLTPFSRGLEFGKTMDELHTIGNVAISCRSCNSTKNEKTLEEFAVMRGFDAAPIRQKATLRSS